MARKKSAAAVASGLRRNAVRIRKALEASGLEMHAQRVVRASPPLRVLGLDINTTSTGYAVVNEHGRVCAWGHVPTAQFASADVLHIGSAIDDALSALHARSDSTAVTWRVGIEAFMRMYRFGRFHNAGIFQLAQLNGIVSYACWQRFSTLPLHTHPSAARGFFGLSASSASSKGASGKSDIKEQVMRFLETQEPELTAQSDGRTNSRTPQLPRLRDGRLAASAFDVADAYIIAAYTRCMHFQEQLVHEPALNLSFQERYLELTQAAKAKTPKSKKPSPEHAALEQMDATATSAYMQELLAYGVDAWLKKHGMELLLAGDVHQVETKTG